MRPPVISVVVAVLVLAACSSTTRLETASETRTPHATATSADGTSLRTEGRPRAAEDDRGAPSVRTGTGVADARATTDAQAPEAGGPSESGALAADDVPVGIRYVEGADQTVGSLGVKGVTAGDTLAMARAVVEHINQSGGLAGRSIAPVFQAYDATSVGGGDAEDEQACAHWTEDNSIVVAVSPFFSSGLLAPCLSERGVPLLEENYGYYDPSRAGDLYFVVGYPDPVRAAFFEIESLVARDFFGQQPTIGIAMLDRPSHRRLLETGWKPALARHGLTVAEVGAFSTPDQMSSVVLRMRASGVTHVLLAMVGLEAQFFMTSAESQGFRPRYGIDTRQAPAALIGNVPAEQLAGVTGTGWRPAHDVGFLPDGERGAPERRCLALMDAAGIARPDPTAESFALAYCNLLFLLQRAAGEAADFDGPSLRAALEGLGDRYTPVGHFGSRFGPGRHDDTAAVRAFTYDDVCGCFAYREQPYAVG